MKGLIVSKQINPLSFEGKRLKRGNRVYILNEITDTMLSNLSVNAYFSLPFWWVIDFDIKTNKVVIKNSNSEVQYVNPKELCHVGSIDEEMFNDTI